MSQMESLIFILPNKNSPFKDTIIDILAEELPSGTFIVTPMKRLIMLRDDYDSYIKDNGFYSRAIEAIL